MDNEAVLKQILNKLGDLETKLTGLETRFDGMETKLSGLETRFDGLENRLTGLESKFDGLESRLTGLETRLDGMETKLSGLETRLKAVFEQTALLKEFKTETEAALTKINKTIESKYDLILRDIELVAGEQGKQRIDIARLKSVIGER